MSDGQQQQQQQQQAAPWHQGVDAEIIGHWQNKGYDLTDPVKVAIEATKQHREAERFVGAPANELLRLPKANAPEADVKAFWARLGAGEAKDYDLSAIKLNGNDLEPAFADAMRNALASAFVPKDKAAGITSAVVKWLESAETSKQAEATAKLNEQMANLDKNWGPNKQANMIEADNGARRLGVSSDEVKAIGQVIGMDRAAEMFRKIGAGTSEDSFHQTDQRKGAMTAEQAQARMNELTADTAWAKRLTSGDAAARREFDSLTQLIAGFNPLAA